MWPFFLSPKTENCSASPHERQGPAENLSAKVTEGLSVAAVFIPLLPALVLQRKVDPHKFSTSNCAQTSASSVTSVAVQLLLECDPVVLDKGGAPETELVITTVFPPQNELRVTLPEHSE